jgi:hypothetical protein
VSSIKEDICNREWAGNQFDATEGGLSFPSKRRSKVKQRTLEAKKRGSCS